MKIAIEEKQTAVPVHKPDLNEKIFFFLSGLLVSVPMTLFFAEFSDTLCVVMPILYAQICSVVIFTPFIEEFSKVFPLFYRHGETERSIVYLGILVGLGFGLTEFFLYVFTLGAPVLVRLPGIVFHASSASISAYGIAKKRPLPFYLIAVALHLANNLFAVVSGLWRVDVLWLVAWLAIFITTYLTAWHLYRRTSDNIVS
ncbi:hypothetical protein KAI30_00770 [Candidatus Bathyarchaeota archaeon]|nr:hypothetical protein [Candidatus Bathyarchaeota archaeon]